MSRRDHYLAESKFVYNSRVGEVTKSKFPTFADGDTLLIVTGARRYKLHSDVLRRSSSVFRVLLDPEAAVRIQSAAARKGTNTKFRLQLIDDPDYNPENPLAVAYIFQRVILDDNGHVEDAGMPTLGYDNENGRSVPLWVTAWEQVLGAFYSKRMELGEPGSGKVPEILQAAQECLKIATYLGCVDVITASVESTILALGQPLYCAIGLASGEWLDFAFRLRSKCIFKEALIHAAGKFNSEEVQYALYNDYLHPDVAAVLKNKADQVRELAKKCELRIASYYPTHLQREVTTGRADRDSIGRSSYANDIMSWMALTAFRHWVAQTISRDMAHTAEDMGFAFFQVIRKGGDHYLDRTSLAEFHSHFPMSQKGEACLENRVSEIKYYVKRFADEPLKNESKVTNRADHMTCAKILPNDYPWLNEVQQPVVRDRSPSLPRVPPRPTIEGTDDPVARDALA